MRCRRGGCEAEGVYIEDESGRRYLDFYGNNCHHIGHRHPAVIAAYLGGDIDLDLKGA